ncbi:four-jointed box protein 1-like [Diadema antillarum]|uniref:four-jointed box protein 1-like n=1 Tax=Diadema antillarum TaxID=105358 RepID=UPI003A88BC93
MALVRLCLYLSAIVLSHGIAPLNPIKKCTSLDCPNEEVELLEVEDAPVYRYSNNAANFDEAKPAPIHADIDTGDNRGHGAASPVTRRSRQENGGIGGTTFQRMDKGSVVGTSALEGSRIQRQHGHQRQRTSEDYLHQEPEESHGDNQRGLKQQQQEQQKQPQTHRHRLGSPVVEEDNPSASFEAVEDGIFWSATVEDAIPPGLSEEEAERWIQQIRKHKVVKVEGGSREKCGSGKNRHVEFEDGSTSCARYRDPMSHFVLGELYCYHLARILGLRNVPTVVLSKVSFTDSTSQWASVIDDVRNAGWTDNTMASFSQWVDGLGRSDLPEILFVNQRKTLTPSSPGFANQNLTQLAELAQFSDLIVFDYITAHLDRMTIRKNAVDYYNMESLYKGEVHNLAKHESNGGLWFIDNENGIFNAYAVAYGYKNKDQMQGYIEEVLHSMCIFRRSTVSMVNKLAKMDDPYLFLNQTVVAEESDANGFNLSMVKPFHISETFKKRVADAALWIESCKSYVKGAEK